MRGRKGGANITMTQENRFERTKAQTQSAQHIRKGMSRAAKHLWYDFLSKYDPRFRRVEVIGDYTVDFFCYKAHLAIDILSPLSRPPEEQREKQLALRAYVIRILYINECDIFNDFPGVCAQIHQAVLSLTQLHPPGR